MDFSSRYSKVFQYLLPSPFTIAILLSILTFFIALFLTKNPSVSSFSYSYELLHYWEEGIWNSSLMVFAMQMMLMLVLGHSLALTPIVNWFINKIVIYADTTPKAAFLVSILTVVVSLFNWGLGLIFGAILARKVGEHAKKLHLQLNYPLIGAAGYSGLMVWHGGFSGSSLTKVAEKNHLVIMMQDIMQVNQLEQLPKQIDFSETTFSIMNIICMLLLIVLIPIFFYLLGKFSSSYSFSIPYPPKAKDEKIEKLVGAGNLDHSSFLSKLVGAVFLFFSISLMWNSLSTNNYHFITPNFINFTLLGLAILFHQNFKGFLKAIDEAIPGAAGILIQFPLYFGIMGIMKGSGLVTELSDFFVSISNESTFPIYTLFSAAIVNIFVPSGGGQWAVQGPIIVQASVDLGISLPKSIMALAYGDQLTNMLQPFWALPLLGITGLKAKEILPYTLPLMFLGFFIYLSVLIIF